MTFPMYIAQRFFFACFRVFVVVVLLFGLFEFIENTRRFSDKADGLSEILIVTLLGLPAQIDRILPLILLLASLTLFIGLARSSELVVSRASGVSAFRVLLVPVAVALIIGILSVAVGNPIVASTIRRYEAMRDSFDNAQRSVSSLSDEGLWLRQADSTGQSVIRARRASPDGVTLFSVDFHVFDSAGDLTQRYIADEAHLLRDHWQLRNAAHWTAAPDSAVPPQPVARLESVSVPTNLTSDQILESFARPETISIWSMSEFINRMETSGFSATRHKLHLQNLMALPVMLAAMVLIGAGFSMRHVRFGQIGTMIVVTVLSGFALFAFQNMSMSLGAAGRVPVEIAAWAPSLGAIMMMSGWLLHHEDG